MINTGHDKNIFECEGNLPYDIEFKSYDNNKKEVAFFSVCTSRKIGSKSVSDKHSFVVKGELLKLECLKQMKKGTRVHAFGILTYIKREGANFPSAEIQCTNVEIIK
jgi:hypothetical protein